MAIQSTNRVPNYFKCVRVCLTQLYHLCKLLVKIQNIFGVSIVAQWLTNLTRNHEVACSIPGLAHWAKDPVLP